MSSLTVREREARHRKYRDQWVPSRVFRVKVAGECAACYDVIGKDSEAVFRRFEGLGVGQLVHVDCIDR